MTDDTPPDSARVVVMTGATSGIGAAALRQLAAEPGTRITVGARGSGREVPTGVETLPLDLASLDSVRAFAAAVTDRLAGTAIDALVLNAGTQSRRRREGRTADGFATTFGVNHLAHYLLARLLVPHLADNARLILTTSDTHDPAVIPFGPRSLDPQALAHRPASGPWAGLRAYAASKLCNLLTARSLAELPELRTRGITVLAYNPGLTAGTDLGDPGPASARFMKLAVYPLFRIFGSVRPAYRAGAPGRAGLVLARLATGALTPPAGHVYVSLVGGEVTYPAPSKLARDNEVRDDLWARSAVMVGLADR